MDISSAASLLAAKNSVSVANATAGFTKQAAQAERGLAAIIEQNVEANKPSSSHKGSVDITV